MTTRQTAVARRTQFGPQKIGSKNVARKILIGTVNASPHATAHHGPGNKSGNARTVMIGGGESDKKMLSTGAGKKAYVGALASGGGSRCGPQASSMVQHAA